MFGRLSVSMPSISTFSLGYGAFLGLYANLRYQLLFGFDRAMFNHFDVIGVALFFSTAMRFFSLKLIFSAHLSYIEDLYTFWLTLDKGVFFAVCLSLFSWVFIFFLVVDMIHIVSSEFVFFVLY